MRDQRDRRAGRLRRVLVCAAAVPVVFVAAGCSSDSGSDDSGSGSAGQSASSSGKTSGSASPTVQAARYHKLPGACDALSKKTLDELVPKGSKSGKEGTSDDVDSRASCSWNSLDSNGVKGSQFRWLNVSLLRFDSDAGRGSGESQAKAYYTKQVQGAQGVSGAKNSKSEPVSGAGNEATAVHYDLKKKEGSFKQTTVVARVENVVITLDYNGAGLAGEKTPDATGLTKDAEKAIKEVVTAVTSANGTGSGSDAGTTKPSPSKSASKPAGGSSSKTASASPSKSASKKS